MGKETRSYFQEWHGCWHGKCAFAAERSGGNIADTLMDSGEEEEESRQELGPADQAGHCLGVDWVRGKEQGGHEGS